MAGCHAGISGRSPPVGSQIWCHARPNALPFPRNPDLLPNSPSEQAIDTADPEVRPEAYASFTLQCRPFHYHTRTSTSDARRVQLHAVRAQSHAGASKKAPTRDAYTRPDAHRASPRGPFQGLLVLPCTPLCAHRGAPVPPIPSEPYIGPCRPHPRQEAGEFLLHHRGAVDRAVGCAPCGRRGLQWR